MLPSTHESTISPAEFRHSAIHSAVNPPPTKTFRKSLSCDSTSKRRRFAKTRWGNSHDSWAVPFRDQSLHRMTLARSSKALAVSPLWRLIAEFWTIADFFEFHANNSMASNFVKADTKKKKESTFQQQMHEAIRKQEFSAAATPCASTSSL
jgi:hypothetical protein